MQRWLNQALHELKGTVINNLAVNFYAIHNCLNKINSVATFEKGKRGNAY